MLQMMKSTFLLSASVNPWFWTIDSVSQEKHNVSAYTCFCTSSIPRNQWPLYRSCISEQRKYRRGPDLMILIISHGTILSSADILHLSTAKAIRAHTTQLWWLHSQCVSPRTQDIHMHYMDYHCGIVYITKIKDRVGLLQPPIST